MRFLASLLVFVALGGVALGEPEEVKAPLKVYATGRVQPKNLPAIKKAAALRNHRVKLPKATAPAFDARQMGWIPPIVDQADCGSCWDFSGCGICTIAFIKPGLQPNDGSFRISEQMVLDCGSNGGCGGDDNTTVLDMCMKQGIPNAADYGPYTASPGRCKPYGTAYKISNWDFVDGSGNGVTDYQLIKNAVAAYGAVGCAVYADSAFMNLEPGQVFQGNARWTCNHDVIICGWDDTKGPAGAVLVRNSWGTGWADGGYGWMAVGANQIGTEAVFCTVATAPPPSSAPLAPAPCKQCEALKRVGPDGAVNWQLLIAEVLQILELYFPPPPAARAQEPACNCGPACGCESGERCRFPAECTSCNARQAVYRQAYEPQPERRLFRGRFFGRRRR